MPAGEASRVPTTATARPSSGGREPKWWTVVDLAEVRRVVVVEHGEEPHAARFERFDHLRIPLELCLVDGGDEVADADLVRFEPCPLAAHDAERAASALDELGRAMPLASRLGDQREDGSLLFTTQHGAPL